MSNWTVYLKILRNRNNRGSDSMSYRKLHIGKEMWEYVVGKEGVKIRGPNKNTYVPKYIFDGYTEGEYRAARQTLYDDDYEPIIKIAVTPRQIKKYIEEELL